MGGKQPSAALNNEMTTPMVSRENITTVSNYGPTLPAHKVTNVGRATAGEAGEREGNDGQREARTQSKAGDLSQKSGHHGTERKQGLGNKTGLGGTHRHSLEKLKEYESQLLQSSAGHPSLQERSNVRTNRESAFEAQQ